MIGISLEFCPASPDNDAVRCPPAIGSGCGGGDVEPDRGSAESGAEDPGLECAGTVTPTELVRGADPEADAPGSSAVEAGASASNGVMSETREHIK